MNHHSFGEVSSSIFHITGGGWSGYVPSPPSFFFKSNIIKVISSAVTDIVASTVTWNEESGMFKISILSVFVYLNLHPPRELLMRPCMFQPYHNLLLITVNKAISVEVPHDSKKRQTSDSA